MSRSENFSTARIKNAIIDVLQLPDLGDGVGDQTLGVDANGVAKVVTGGGGGAASDVTSLPCTGIVYQVTATNVQDALQQIVDIINAL